ncbi:MAG: hypothetical protein H7177_04095 [Rhizobacter sp.]|nr:hypothetical protein [Bacteriovorax sp.]
MKKIIFLLAVVCSLNVFAHEEVLTTTDNDDNDEVYTLVVSVNDDTQTLEKLFKDTYVNGAKVRRDNLNEEDMKTKGGMILEKRDQYNVLNLKSDNFDHDLGGKIVIDTLYNGIKGDRKKYDIDLAKDPTGWKIFKDNKIITKFHVKVNRVIIVGTVGIKNIIME